MKFASDSYVNNTGVEIWTDQSRGSAAGVETSSVQTENAGSKYAAGVLKTGSGLDNKLLRAHCLLINCRSSGVQRQFIEERVAFIFKFS